MLCTTSPNTWAMTWGVAKRMGEESVPENAPSRKIDSGLGDRFLSSAGAGGICARPMRLLDPSPVLDKNHAPMGPEILSSTGDGVWRKAPVAFPDSSSVLDKFQSAMDHSKRLLVCSVVDFCTGKTEQRHPRGWKTYRTRGVQNPFLGGVSFVRFSSSLFFPPPMRPLNYLHLVQSGTKFDYDTERPGYKKKLFKVPEGHHPRGTTLREALRGNLPLRGFSGPLRGSLPGFCGVSAGLCGGLQGSTGFSEGSDPTLVTLGNCWKLAENTLM